MTEFTVSAGLVTGLLDLAVSKGADRSALLGRAGISAQDFADLDNRIALSKYVILMRAGKELSRDPALALHYGETNDFSQVSVVGLIGLACETMSEAFTQLNRYGRLVVEYDGGPERFKMVPEHGDLWLVDSRGNPNDFFELTESTFARMICGPRAFGVTQLAKAVHVTHAAPPYRDEYERIFGAPVTFECRRNALLLDRRWDDHRIQKAPRYAFGILSEHARTLLDELERSRSLRGRVEAVLVPILHKGDISMDGIAEKMGMSRQTLFRRLKTEATTYERVLEELRHKLAVHYLNGRKVSVNQTAYLVGFSDPAAFSRAFKRWTGSSPSAVRRDRMG